MPFRWPAPFERVPDEAWTHQPVEGLALKYDTVENHGWYANLEPTVEALGAVLRDDDLIVDYSGGTGILCHRLLERLGPRPIGVVIADASPKFLRLALDKLGGDERVAFRLIHYLRDEKRLQRIDEVLAGPIFARGVDGIVSTNAVHLYYHLPETLQAWARLLRPGAWAHVQSGNMRNPDAPAGAWIIDETVEAIHLAAVDLVRTDARWAAYRGVLADATRMSAYDALRRKYFLPVRPLDHYLDALRGAGLRIDDVRLRVIQARVDEWYQFLAVYHEGVLGWVGGAEKVEEAPASPAAVADRLEIMREAMARTFGRRGTFDACWTYVTARRP